MSIDAETAASQREINRARLARWLFELLYRNRTLYWLASTLPFAGQWRVWQRLALTRLRGSDVLEVGCGIGSLLADMVASGFQCQAVDRSPQMVAAARRELRRRGLAADTRIVQQASVQALPFDAASFDCVVSTFPTEYIADPAALREIERVLRPGGKLIVVLGAALLPTRPLLRPLIAVQRLVYGRAEVDAQTSAQPDAQPAIVAPLLDRMRAAGFAPTMERVAGPFWVAYVITAYTATNT
ncbi:MAG TPA: class I SAM-dependent methyltransferase [Ktedonobacterales bacterium]